MRNIIFIFVFLFSNMANALDRDELIKKIIEAQGLQQTFEQQIFIGNEINKEKADLIIEKASIFMNYSPEFKVRIEEAYQQYFSEISSAFSVEEMVSVWASYYGKHFTDKELKRLLKYYQSPLAQKEIEANRTTMIEVVNHFANVGESVSEKSLDKFISKIEIIIKECNCSN